MLNLKYYQTVKEKFLYGYFVVFLTGTLIGFFIRLYLEQYVIAFLDVVAFSVGVWLAYDYEKRRDVRFASLVLFWMISLFMFYYIYHLGYDITIFQLLPIPIAAAMTLDTKTYKRHGFLFVLLFVLLMSYGFYHKDRYVYLQDDRFVWQASITILFSFGAGLVWHYTINRFNERLQETNTLLRRSNDEKTALLKEIHHRVKNNLNLMTSILGLQEENASNEEMRQFVKQNRLRIKSIALVHELLYKDENFKTIRPDVYISNLVEHILDLSGRKEVGLHLHIGKLELSTDDIIHIGIIVNELVTNSLKYAKFEEKARIDIALRWDKRGHILEYRDNGAVENPNKQIKNGFGLNLMHLSVAHLSGRMEIGYDSEGFRALIVFYGRAG